MVKGVKISGVVIKIGIADCFSIFVGIAIIVFEKYFGACRSTLS